MEPVERSVDLMFVAHNRFEFTKIALETLVQNTDLRLLDNATVYDDMSTDGTSEWLADKCTRIGFRHIRKKYGSVVAVMQEAIKSCQTKYLAKIDNDTMVPPGWLNVCVKQLEADCSVDLLGIEPMHGIAECNGNLRICERAENIGGIGLMRLSAFRRCGLPEVQGYPYYGFTEWQHIHRDEVVPAWLNPAIPVCLLDHVPFDPWKSLSDEYIKRGWQRKGIGFYDDSQDVLWRWWAKAATT